MKKTPLVSIIVPCKNENSHIERCVNSILAQDFPMDDFELVVVDGMSDDGTRDILARLAKESTRLRIVDNPSGTTPYALNTGINAARGRHVAILGAHTEYAPDYVRACVDLLNEHPEVCCVGGPIVSQGRGRFGHAVAAVMSHPVGVGNARHRHPNYEGYAEGACFPMFRKEIFETIGLYDTALVRNQDDELNYRLARHGGKVFISPRARCIYYVRDTPSKLFRQYFQYGFWRVAVLKKHGLPAAFRQIIPPMFFLLSLMAFIGGLLLPGWWRLTALLLPLLYGITLLGVGAGVARNDGWLTGLFFPVAASIMHLAYAAGFTWAALNGPRSPSSSVPHTKGEYHASRT